MPHAFSADGWFRTAHAETGVVFERCSSLVRASLRAAWSAADAHISLSRLVARAA
jgi:hypothetical protein